MSSARYGRTSLSQSVYNSDFLTAGELYVTRGGHAKIDTREGHAKIDTREGHAKIDTRGFAESD